MGRAHVRLAERLVYEGREAWMLSAACIGQGEEVFFPGKGKRGAEAKRICDSCVVRDDCRDYADRHDTEYGVWGGVLHQPDS